MNFPWTYQARGLAMTNPRSHPVYPWSYLISSILYSSYWYTADCSEINTVFSDLYSNILNLISMQHYEEDCGCWSNPPTFLVARFSVIKMQIIPRMTYQFKMLLLFFSKLTANCLSLLSMLICQEYFLHAKEAKSNVTLSVINLHTTLHF